MTVLMTVSMTVLMTVLMTVSPTPPALRMMISSQLHLTAQLWVTFRANSPEIDSEKVEFFFDLGDFSTPIFLTLLPLRVGADDRSGDEA